MSIQKSWKWNWMYKNGHKILCFYFCLCRNNYFSFEIYIKVASYINPKILIHIFIRNLDTAQRPSCKFFWYWSVKAGGANSGTRSWRVVYPHCHSVKRARNCPMVVMMPKTNCPTHHMNKLTNQSLSLSFNAIISC